MADIPMITGAELGTQIHVRAVCPRPRHMKTPAMVGGGYGGFRELNQPLGGMWSATLGENGATAYIDYAAEHDPRYVQGLKWWRLEPEPDARILRINSEADYAAALDCYRYQESIELNFVAMFKDGVDAVQLTNDGIADNAPHFDTWKCESVVWLRWSVTEPTPYRPPEEYQHLFDKPPRKSGKLATRTARYRLDGEFAGFWFSAKPLKKKQKQRIARALKHRDNGAMSADNVSEDLDDIGEMIIGEQIIDHNFTHANGTPLPTGSLLSWRIPADLAKEVLQTYFMGLEKR